MSGNGTSRYDALDQIKIAKPCPASWDDMQGDDKRRFCTHCSHHVFNISNMSRAEASDLIEKSDGRVCVRMYQRTDGKVMTKDCGRPLASISRRSRLGSVAVAILSAFGLGNAFARGAQTQHHAIMGDVAVTHQKPEIMGKLMAPTNVAFNTGRDLGNKVAGTLNQSLEECREGKGPKTRVIMGRRSAPPKRP